MKRCIRCRSIVHSQVTYRTCDTWGIGDWIHVVISAMGFSNCDSCSKRRAAINEWDRATYRRVFR